MKDYRNPWAWIPTLYLAEGFPYVLVMTVSVILYKNLGIGNAEIAFYTSWLYLPWVIKPFWSPMVDLIRTKRWWIYSMQLLLSVGLAGIAFTLPTTYFFQASLAFFYLMAFSSATHDIAADGFYMLGLNEKDQSLFVGIRNIFYRLSNIFGQGILVMIAGYLIHRNTDIIIYNNLEEIISLESWSSFSPSQECPYDYLQKYTHLYDELPLYIQDLLHESKAVAWSWVFGLCAVIMATMGIYHFFILPRPQSDTTNNQRSIKELFVSFYSKKGIWTALAFILLYRLGEAQLTKIASPFLLEARENMGLGITTETVGLIYGTIGVIALLLGGILGGILAAKDGLKKWIWPMVLAMNIPNLAYVYLAYALPENTWVVTACIAIEQLGYGFGFTAFMLYLIQVSKGPYQTAHYALCTGFMALGMMLPGMIAGYIQEWLGYGQFFIWVCLCTIPGMLLIPKLKIE